MVVRAEIVEKLPDSSIIKMKTDKNRTLTMLIPQNFRDTFKYYKEYDYILATNIPDQEYFEYTPNTLIQKDIYTSISELSSAYYSNICAIVLSARALTKTKGTDFLFSLNLYDGTEKIELKVFILKKEDFKKFIPSNINKNLDFSKQQNFEKVFKRGDILSVRNIKRGFNDSIGIIHKECDIIKIYECCGTKNSDSEKTAKNIDLKLEYLKYIFNSCSSIQSSKLIKISDIKENIYFDIVGKVIFMESGQVITVCITDYTHSKVVNDLGGTKYPNDTILYIKMFGKHAVSCKSIVVGRVYLFKNVRINSIDSTLISHMSESVEGEISLIKEQSILDEFERMEREKNGANLLCDERENEGNLLSKSNKGILMGSKVIDIPAIEEIDSLSKIANDPIVYTDIKNIKKPGLYFIKCRVLQYHIHVDNNGPYIQILVCDRDSSMKISARHKISAQIIQEDSLRTEQDVSFMVLHLLEDTGEKNLLACILQDYSSTAELKDYIANDKCDL